MPSVASSRRSASRGTLCGFIIFLEGKRQSILGTAAGRVNREFPLKRVSVFRQRIRVPAPRLGGHDRLDRQVVGGERGERRAVRLEREQRRPRTHPRSEEHTSELQSRRDLVCRLLLEKKKKQQNSTASHLL